VSGTLREALLRDYREGQAAISSPASYRDTRSLWPYFDANYSQYFTPLSRTSHILEIGPGHGGFLGWLRAQGFERIEGVDSSPGDVQFANRHLGGDVVRLGDAREFLLARPAAYHAIVMKAVLEHVRKEDILEFLLATSAAIVPAGLVVIDVPNMDWLLAMHERYMDLTHEVGFTQESLTSLLRLAFDDITVSGSKIANPTRAQRLFRHLLVRLLRAGLYVLGEGADGVIFTSRSLIAVARKPRAMPR
jgi:2-polyprenyl-3-methyl-5-hydroxy-6-metoxy-1,4-benzoquinol methylase